MYNSKIEHKITEMSFETSHFRGKLKWDPKWNDYDPEWLFEMNEGITRRHPRHLD